jgi:Zn-dependent protease
VNASFKIGNAFGIPVRIHATFLLLVYALLAFFEQPLVALGLTGLSFACVLLHELGHSLVARGFGLRVADITLWPLGGIARMSEIPENSRIEALIAIAGPAVNFALAGTAFLLLTTGLALGLASPDLFVFFIGANLVQGGFNLLPAFPMDGGRILRAFLGRKRDWLAATEIAVRVGRAVALLFLLASILLLRHGAANVCVLPLVALFVWFEGTRELWSVRLRHGVSPFGAALRFGWRPPRPAHAEQPEPPRHDEEPVRGSARRPRTWWQRISRKGGFSEADVRWLEAHPGPLRRPPDDS